MITRLDHLIEQGCILATAAGVRTVLASAAMLPEKRLWFWGIDDERAHQIPADQVEVAGPNLNFRDEDGQLVATISALEDADDDLAWRAWRDERTTDRDSLIEHHKHQALTW